MKILIYGKGWISTQIVEILKKLKINYKIGISRVNKFNSLKLEINSLKPTHIICLIGRTHGKINNKIYSTIDYLENAGKLKENIRDNLFAPLNLAIICKKLKIHLTYFGTGCIFKYDNEHKFGEKKNGFKENDFPNFFNSSYSTVKGFTDQLMHNFENVLNLRIRMPISSKSNPRDFITKITSYQKICSIPNSMTVLPVMLPIVIDLIKKNKTGTYNLTNPGLISHNEILKMYRNIVNPNFTWKNFSLEEQAKILASERSNNFLDTNKLEKEYPKIPNIHDAVRECLESYPKIKWTILITGGAGFIGSNFINYAINKRSDWFIVNLDAMYYCANKNFINSEVQNSGRYKFVKGNICDSKLVTNILKSNNITHVIHFAAQSHVQNSFKDASIFVKDNVLGTQTLLECVREYGKIQKFIHVSTDEVYGESLMDENENCKTEKSILCPTNPYSATQSCCRINGAQSYYAFI